MESVRGAECATSGDRFDTTRYYCSCVYHREIAGNGKPTASQRSFCEDKRLVECPCIPLHSPAHTHVMWARYLELK